MGMHANFHRAETFYKLNQSSNFERIGNTHCVGQPDPVNPGSNCFHDNFFEKSMVGTGGISHWPATPDSGKINEDWDREFMRRWCENDRAQLLDYDDLTVYRDAGQGGFEIRTYLTVAAAAEGSPGTLDFYAPIPIFAVGCTIATYDLSAAS